MESEYNLIKRIAALLLKNRIEGLTPEELAEMKDLLARRGVEDAAMLSGEMLDAAWLRDAYNAYEEGKKRMEPNEEALKKVWERINKTGE